MSEKGAGPTTTVERVVNAVFLVVFIAILAGYAYVILATDNEYGDSSVQSGPATESYSSSVYLDAIHANDKELFLQIAKSDPSLLPTELRIAVSHGSLEMARFFIDKGVSVSDPDLIGWTPLDYAVSAGKKEMILFLLERGADINYQHAKGDTLLSDAVTGGNYEMAQFLIQHGAKAGDKEHQALQDQKRAAKGAYEGMLESAWSPQEREEISALYMKKQRDFEVIEKLLLEEAALPAPGEIEPVAPEEFQPRNTQ